MSLGLFCRDFSYFFFSFARRTEKKTQTRITQLHAYLLTLIVRIHIRVHIGTGGSGKKIVRTQVTRAGETEFSFYRCLTGRFVKPQNFASPHVSVRTISE